MAANSQPPGSDVTGCGPKENVAKGVAAGAAASIRWESEKVADTSIRRQEL